MSTPTPELTEDQINQRIQEILGWKTIEEPSTWNASIILTWYKSPEGQLQASPPPSFCGSLDAMAVVEATLTDEQWLDYLHQLGNGAASFRRSIGGVAMTLDLLRTNFVSATAKQRALAFIAIHENQ